MAEGMDLCLRRRRDIVSPPRSRTTAGDRLRRRLLPTTKGETIGTIPGCGDEAVAEEEAAPARGPVGDEPAPAAGVGDEAILPRPPAHPPVLHPADLDRDLGRAAEAERG